MFVSVPFLPVHCVSNEFSYEMNHFFLCQQKFFCCVTLRLVRTATRSFYSSARVFSSSLV